jgi:hypothetical protein
VGAPPPRAALRDQGPLPEEDHHQDTKQIGDLNNVSL